MPETENTSMTGGRWAARLCVVLLIGFTLLIVFAVHDKRQLANLEKVSEPTAVGDSAFFKLPEKLEANTAIARFGGELLYPGDTEPREGRDIRMLRVAMDDSKSFWIYRSSERKSSDPEHFFLKVGAGEYLATTRTRLSD